MAAASTTPRATSIQTPPASASFTTPMPQPPSATGWDTGSGSAPPTSVMGSSASEQAAALATTAMRLFARRSVSEDQWWHDLSPLLTPQAQQAYQGTDPRNVEPTRLTGTAGLTNGSTPLTARVSIDTDAGLYLVILTRTDDHASWLVDRISPPETVGQGS